MNIQILEVIFRLCDKSARYVLRGSSWFISHLYTKCSARTFAELDGGGRTTGFRLVQEK